MSIRTVGEKLQQKKENNIIKFMHKLNTRNTSEVTFIHRYELHHRVRYPVINYYKNLKNLLLFQSIPCLSSIAGID